MPGHKPEEAEDAIHAEIERLKTEDISDDELKMIKTRAKANLMRGLADNEGLAEQLAFYQTRYGDWRELFRQVDRIDAVSKADIRRVANQVFVANNRTVGIIETATPLRRTKEARNESNARYAMTFLAVASYCCAVPFASAQVSRLEADQNPAAAGFPSSGAEADRAAQRHGHLPSGRSRTATDRWQWREFAAVRAAEPAAKAGLLDLYGEVWRTGGTKAQTGDQLDDYLEIRAAKVETDANADSTTISLSCLKGNFDDVFKVFVELLREPEFREDKLDLAKHEAR